MIKAVRTILIALLLLPTSCMEWDYGYVEEFNAKGEGLFICNEGNFQYGNATLSYYNPDTKRVENEVFYRANAMKLGDVTIAAPKFEQSGKSQAIQFIHEIEITEVVLTRYQLKTKSIRQIGNYQQLEQQIL